VSEALALAAGLLIGVVSAWLVAASRARARAAQQAAEMQSRLSAAESTLGEVRQQLSRREQELTDLRSTLQGEQQARVSAETRLSESLKHIAEQKQLLDEAEKKLKDAFAALSLESLRQNSEEFARRTAEKVRPLEEALRRYEAELKRIEEARQQAYGGLTEQLKAIASTHQQLSRETTGLVQALRSPQVKGRWGEITLQRAVEVAGLSPHCDFVPQMTVGTEDGRLRPDLVVTLPGGRTVVVDAKAPTGAYLDAVAAQSESERQAHLARHAAAIRAHMQNLSGKAYWAQFDAAPEFVVMFVPGEAFFSAALEQDRELIEDGIRRRVILASPTTLIALLHAVAYSWRQQELIENARRIGQTAAELFDRVCKFAEHFGKVGDGLRRATDAFNDAIGSWERRVLPLGRRVAELGATSRQGELVDIKRVEVLPQAPPPATPGDQPRSPV